MTCEPEAFDAAAWLNELIRLGGGYLHTSVGVRVVYPPNDDAISHVNSTVGDRTKWEAIRDLILSTTVQEIAPC